jgi:hypothetical protein
MLKSNYSLSIASARAVSTGWLVVCGLCLVTKAGAVTPVAKPAIPLIQPAEAQPELDSRRLNALGMIETGNDDRAVGAAGEVSRYQLAPPVWRSYSSSMDYRNPAVSLQVARLHWNHLAAYFKEKTGHTPTDFDMYVLWNTRYGYYAHFNFSHTQVSSIVRDRAQRFVNLVNRKD